MPHRAHKICNFPGCQRTIPGSERYCEAHLQVKKKEWTQADRRPSSHSRGYNYQWSVWSKKLKKETPYCEKCGATKNLVVDHKIPFEIMSDIFGGNTFKREHYQVLCIRCNSYKSYHYDRPTIENYFKNRDRK